MNITITKLINKIFDGDTIKVEPLSDGENAVCLLGIDMPVTKYIGRS